MPGIVYFPRSSFSTRGLFFQRQTIMANSIGTRTMSDASADKQRLPLQGVRVLELSHIVAGPSGGMILADLGADVIKIEHPATGDTARNHANRGGTFYTFNRNKQYLALDLRQAEGKKIFEKLVARSDIVLDNFVP